MRRLIRFQPLSLNSSDPDLLNSQFSRIIHLQLSTLSKASKPSRSKKDQLIDTKSQTETSSFSSLLNQITEILGVDNIISDRTPSGISISKEGHSRNVDLFDESVSRTQDVCRNAEDGALLGKKEPSISDGAENGNAFQFDVSPVVQKVTQIVRRAENAVASMEEQLERTGFQFGPEIVEKVLKRCFKVPHLALRFFNWVKLKDDFCHTTETYNTMLYMAGEVEDFRLVEKLLKEMEEKSCEKNIKTWTILIMYYGNAKLIGKALLLFEDMRKCGCEPDTSAYRIMIRSLCNADKGELAFEFYKEMVQKEMLLGLSLYKMLLKSLARSGDTAAVYSVADDMMRLPQISEHDVYSYVLESFCISGRIREALKLICDLKNKQLPLDSGYFEILVKGLCRTDRISDALEILDIMKRRQLVNGKIYGIIISGYLKRNDLKEALDMFQNMKEYGCLPTTATYTELMQHLFKLNEYQKGCELYNEMLDRGIEPDGVAIITMVAGHVRENHISEAWEVFKTMENRGVRPTPKSYSIFIKELCKVARTDEVLKVLNKMHASEMVIDYQIFRQVISCMKRRGEMDNVEKVKQMQRRYKLHYQEGEISSNGAARGQERREEMDNVEKPKQVPGNYRLHYQEGEVFSKDATRVEEPFIELNYNQPALQGTDCHLVEPLKKAYNEEDLHEIGQILSSPINWYHIQEALEKCTVHFTPELVVEILKNCTLHVKAALHFFSWVGKQPGYRHTTGTYNMAIKISGVGKDFKHMRNLFYDMRRGGLVTPDTWVIMIVQYGRTGLTDIALRTFSQMKADGFIPTNRAYKYLIILLCEPKGRKVDEAINIFQEMIRAGRIPDKELLGTYLGCLCEAGKLLEARNCADSLSKIGFTVPLSYSIYIRALCRAGRLEKALRVLDEIGEERSTVDQYVYGSLVHGLLQNGRFEDALAKVDSMKQDGIYPTIHVYTSLITHFFKEKQMDRALEIFNKMREEGCEPNVVTYSALIRGYMDMGRAVDAWDTFYRMKLKGPVPDFKTYSMFINCLCTVGRSEEALQLLHEMPDNGIAPSTINFRTVFHGLNREGKQDLAKTVVQRKSAFKSNRKF